MTEAVKSENYELAAQIRDQIKDLEEKTEKEKDA
jgi:protein-arginine kinase activator protein McsA